MAYYLKTEDGLFGPIANDNPERDTYEDERIKRKAVYWAKRLKGTLIIKPIPKGKS